jgi:hypothetical protein
MADPGNGGEIIIKGGSVEVEYDDKTYVGVPGEPRKHRAEDKKIIQVEITDETNPAKPVLIFNSEEHLGGLKWKIKATCR